MTAEASSMRVVGIGASAGGMEALNEFFKAMPADNGMAFVIIQHLDPSHVSYMAGLLGKHTAMAVAQAEDGMALRPNSVYTIPPNKFLLIKEGRLQLTATIKRDGIRMPIDFFFRSLAHEQREKAIGVLLSGSGSDGTLGIREIHAAGGIAMVQEPATAQFDFMLQSALATGLVDAALPPAEIPAALLNYVQQADGEGRKSPEPEAQDDVDSILGMLARQVGSDFKSYKKSMVWRRIQRRMGLSQITDVADYARLLRQKPDEIPRLSKDMLIGVTSFFRDPDAFEELRVKVILPLIKEKKGDDPWRAWAVGCSTGEEAYSIAMLVREEMGRNKRNFPLQVFASDIDPEALKCAREGIYPESIAVDLSEERLRRFFIKKDHSYQITKEVRDAVTFAAHNLLADPPFLKMDLISCRNLLIYIESEMQKKLQTVFAFALKPGAYLFLGKSDSVMENSGSFEPVSRNFRIYRRKQSLGAQVGNLPALAGLPAGLHARAERRPAFKLSDLNQDVLLKHFDAGIVLIDESGAIMHFYGPTHKYLAHPTGDANLNLFEMIENRHSLKLRFAVEKAFRENVTVALEALEFGREIPGVNVTVSCCTEPKSGMRLAAVIFQEAHLRVKSAPLGEPGAESREHADLFAQLEGEIKRLKDELQATTDGYQTSHEELTAANEEVLAINEELQSTNEELETSKEELQSVNEELVAANGQLNEKIEELNQTNDDVANFLNSTEVGTIFLDSAFCIRRFTPSATRLLNLLPLDIGRPVEHISNKFLGVNLVAVAESVLKNLGAIEKELEASDGSWHMMRCLPYRTLGNKIDGVVFTFTEVTELKRSEEAILEARNYAESIINTTGEPLVVLDPELKIVSANRAFYDIFHVSPEETEQRLIYDVGNHQWDIPSLRKILDKILLNDVPLENFEVAHEFPRIGPKIMSLNARRLLSATKGDLRLILLGIQDITDRSVVARERQELNLQLEKRVSERTSELEHANRALALDMEERKGLEEQLRRAQLMESIGTLAGGIAHDFNNILNVIQGYASSLSDAKDGETAECIQAINTMTNRGAALVRQLLTLARKTDSKAELIDVNALIEKLSHLLKETFPKNIEVTLDLNRELARIMADPNQLNQALLNLCTNARDAMPDGGKVTLKTQVVDGTSLLDGDESKAGRYVGIEVSDTGTGIDESVRSRIFEPFFTTKEADKGTGLGLAVVYGIVKNHKGSIQMESKPAQGTTFCLYFPVVPGS